MVFNASMDTNTLVASIVRCGYEFLFILLPTNRTTTGHAEPVRLWTTHGRGNDDG